MRNKTMAKKKDVLEIVTEKYGPINNEWVVEKGKVHETKLIKQLALELDEARSEAERYYELYWERCRSEHRDVSKIKEENSAMLRAMSQYKQGLEYSLEHTKERLEYVEQILAKVKP